MASVPSLQFSKLHLYQAVPWLLLKLLSALGIASLAAIPAQFYQLRGLHDCLMKQTISAQQPLLHDHCPDSRGLQSPVCVLSSTCI